MNKKLFVFTGFIAILVLIPIFIKDPYILHLLINLLIAVSSAIGLGLLMSGGMISLAQAGIMAIGAYSSALLVMNVGLSFWLALPLSGLITMTIGVLIAYPTLRLKGLYFIMVTFAINEIIRLFAINGPNVLGGHNGIPNVPKPNPITLPGLPTIEFVDKTPYFYLISLILLLNFFFIYRIYNSRLGRTLKTFVEGENLSSSVGINVMKYKAIVFGIVCFFGGVNGSFLAHYSRLVSPDFFTIWVSIYYVIYAQVGGHATILGPILGAIFFSILPEFFRGIAQFSPVVFGGLLILAILFLPGGLETLPKKIVTWGRRIFSVR